MSNLKDFGEKIGGARKDLWKTHGLTKEDLADLTPLERQTLIKKDNIWPRPNWNRAIKEGTPQCVAYWQNKMRQAIPPRPKSTDEYDQMSYIATVAKIRDAVMKIRDSIGIDKFYQDFLRPQFIRGSDRGYYISVTPEADAIITNKVLKVSQSSHTKMQREAEKHLFGIPKEEQTYVATKNRFSVYCYDGEQVTLSQDEHQPDTTILTRQDSWSRSYSYLRTDREFSNPTAWQKGTYFVFDRITNKPVQINFQTEHQAKEHIETLAKAAQEAANKAAADKEGKGTARRKGTFTPPQLRRVKRTGPDYRMGHHAQHSMFLKDLKFRGGEYGNWLSDNDRQTSLDMAYDALRDLARLLQIKPEDVSLNETLAIAFGARGRGGSGSGAAHYEPDRQVINLTKLSGAGCLAHEWGHALDHAIGLSAGSLGLASESTPQHKLPEEFRDLMDAMKYKTAVIQPEEIRKEWSPKIDRCAQGLSDWLKSVQPDQMSEPDSVVWNAAAQQILDKAKTFTGAEYQASFRRGAPMATHPTVEYLSQLRKQLTGHVIPKSTKIQICLWARDLGRARTAAQAAKPVERRIATDYYRNSQCFDQSFSKSGHGYWQSNCELFARAFDCYISDKLKESGTESTYLSGHANSYLMPGPDNKPIAAFPEGEERKRINEKFDTLLSHLKERGILHHHVEPEQTHAAPRRPSPSSAPPQSTHFEQLSFEDLLFHAKSRAAQATEHQTPTRDIPRQNRG